MKIYIILKADYCEWSTEYGFAKPVEIKLRKALAEDAVSFLNGKNPTEQYYYEEMVFSLKLIPSITSDQVKTLNDVDVFNQGEQLNELIIMERIREINELKDEVKKLKRTVSSEAARANRAESIRERTEQELKTIRNAIKADRKKDKPKFLGFMDTEGKMYPVDPNSKNCVLMGFGQWWEYSYSISSLRKRKGELTPVYEAMPAQ